MRMRHWVRAPFLLLVAGLAIGAYSSLTFTHLAGSPGGPGSEDGVGTAARFSQPSWIASDSSGNLYVSDTLNATLRKILPTGEVRTLAGVAGSSDTYDGFGAHARLWSPAGVAVDSNGNVFVVDNELNTIKKITAEGFQSTFAGGSQQPGYVDGNVSVSKFNYPNGIAVDSGNNLYVTEYGGGAARIRKITPAGITSTFAGGGTQGWADGTGTAAIFRNPAGIAYDASTNSLLVADYGDHVIRRITIPGAVVTTVAGMHGSSGHVNANGTSAQFSNPLGISVDGSGNAYITEGSNRVRRMAANGDVTDVAGGSSGSTDGVGAAARFDGPFGLTVNPADGKVYVCDQNNHTIRKIDGTTVSTFAGMSPGFGFSNATGTDARFDHPSSLAYYPGPSGIDIFVADRDNNAIRKVTAPGGVVTTFAGSGVASYVNGNGTSAAFNHPEGVVVDFGTGSVYVADSGNNVIRKITSTGDVTLYAGNPAASGSTNGDRLTAARFYHPMALAIYGSKMYVADGYNYRLRVIDMTSGAVSNVLDNASNIVGFSTIPQGLTIEGAGTLVWGDAGFIFKLTQAGVKTTFAGSGQPTQTPSPYDGTGSGAGFAYPGPPGIAVNNSGNGYVADGYAYCVRSIDSAANVVTVGGKLNQPGSADGTGNNARFAYPRAAMLYSTGVIVADQASLRLGLPAIADAATIDAATGQIGVSRQLSTSPNTATSWQWSIIRKPAGSAATLSSTTIRNPTFVPDVADLYVFRCVATSASGSSITTVSLQATGPATSLYLAYPGPIQAGSTFGVNVQALDAYGNDAADFTGTVHFTSSTDSNATMPADHTFTLAEDGYATVSGFSFRHAGLQSITATVTGTGLTATTSFNVYGGPPSSLQVVAPATVRGGTAFNITVTGLDAYGNAATSMSGHTLHFTSSDGAATLPANYTFTGADGNSKQFSVTLRTGGLRSITATDTITASITGTTNTTVKLQNLLGDQNQDGNSDLYWRSYTTGANAVWLMNGTSYSGTTVNLPALPSTSYRISGIADFDADGQPDVLWRNASTGANAIWIMRGATIFNTVNLPALANPDYVIGGTGDFNGDAKPDIVWRNQVTGANAIWIMNGTSFSGTVVNLPALPNPDYRIEGTADFDNSGTPDIVWRNYVSGANALWLMNGTTFSGTVVNLSALPNPDYHIEAAADFNSDTHPDIVWRNQTTGANAIWVLNGSVIVSTVNLPALPNSSYEMGGPR